MVVVVLLPLSLAWTMVSLATAVVVAVVVAVAAVDKNNNQTKEAAEQSPVRYFLKSLLTSVVGERVSPNTVASWALFSVVAIQQNRN